MAYNSLIHGLVTREQFCATYPQNPLVSGLRQSYGNPGTAGPVCGVTKPKARSPMGFLLSSRPTRQGASANGPAWAAPKEHRLPRKGESDRTGVSRGPVWCGRPANPLNDSSKGDAWGAGACAWTTHPLKPPESDRYQSETRPEKHRESRGITQPLLMAVFWRN